MKIQEAAMILEEQTAKVAEAIKLFLQGMGFVLKTRRKPNDVSKQSSEPRISPENDEEEKKKHDDPDKTASDSNSGSATTEAELDMLNLNE